jgi:hypothetical protein
MNKKVILIVAGLLILIGLLKPDLGQFIPNNSPSVNPAVVVEPTDVSMKEKADLVVSSLKNGSNDRKNDGKKLSSLYADLALLVSLDGEDQVIKSTEEIKQANLIAGSMLRMNMKDKYPDLAKNANAVIVSAIGDDNAVLSKDLRAKAVDAFSALSWACDQGSK